MKVVNSTRDMKTSGRLKNKRPKQEAVKIQRPGPKNDKKGYGGDGLGDYILGSMELE